MLTRQDDKYAEQRRDMVQSQIKERGIENERLLSAIESVKRHEFVPEQHREYAYYDGPLPIGNDQTISQPYIVALMTDLLSLSEGDKVLEIGTGCGYQTAVLSELCCEVYTVEIIGDLSKKAKKLLRKLGYRNVHFKIGDGYEGWQEHAPYDAVIVTACPHVLPQPLIDQLKWGGRMVIPLEEEYQELKLITKKKDGLEKERITAVRFVPMTGQAERIF